MKNMEIVLWEMPLPQVSSGFWVWPNLLLMLMLKIFPFKKVGINPYLEDRMLHMEIVHFKELAAWYQRFLGWRNNKWLASRSEWIKQHTFCDFLKHTKNLQVILKVRNRILQAFHSQKDGHQMTEFHEDSDVTYGHVRKPRFENR